MDFEAAAQRLARDQQKLRGRKTMVVSAKAKREADYRKKQQEQKRQERFQQQKQHDFIQKFMTACDRSLGVKSLLPAAAGVAAGGGLQLSATSIHGEGDKIALPPSVLERLTQSMAADYNTSSSSPWLFRIGILNPEYQFPASVLLKTLKPTNDDDDDDDDDAMQDDSVEDNATNSASKAAYLDELGHKYISYTHGTVVEFTQDEGHVGLPAPMAAALLNPKRRLTEHASYEIPMTRTLDPSKATFTDTPKISLNDDDDDENDVAMDDTHSSHQEDEDMAKTPGHVAYGAFDVPDMPVEITMLRLPKGKGCTLTPTHEAIRNGFYNLQDVKLVLEQSLIRTRATLSVGDTVQTWHRGVSYDLLVSKVIPSMYHAITCINTDIEVELGEVNDFPEEKEPCAATTTTTAAESIGHTLSGGRVLSAPSPLASPELPGAETTKPPELLTADLVPEPPMDQREGICTVQLRVDGIAPARRRFDVQVATLQDLFDFAKSLLASSDAAPFRLVTRFPRNVFELNDENRKTVMAEAGIQSGQHLMMVERI